jgi:acetylornithine deacetylase/succinyl-diaminopimelate desuccinylase-like protein
MFIGPDALYRCMIAPEDRTKVYSVLDARLENFVSLLKDYVRVPTISAHRTKFQEGADATRTVLETAGADVRLVPEENGPPVVVGEVTEDPSLPWVILYNHYDVQPVDPLDEWTSGPFDPVVREGTFYGRGAADTKGNTVAQALAVRAIRDVVGHLPVNVRFFIDGEEESGSPHLLPFADARLRPTRGTGNRPSASARRASSASTFKFGRRMWTSTRPWPP